MFCPCIIGGVNGIIAGAHHIEGVCAVVVGVAFGIGVVGDVVGGGVEGGIVPLGSRAFGL